jgi:hypothetical protein
LEHVTNSQTFGHGLKELAHKFGSMVKSETNETVPGWLEDLIQVFHDSDRSGTTFRYGGNIPGDEVFIDITHVKKLMTWFSESFDRFLTRSE